MKTYVANRMKLPRRIGPLEVDNFQAASDFLKQVLVAAGAYTGFANEEVAFTVPVEAFEGYHNWLDDLAQSAGRSMRAASGDPPEQRGTRGFGPVTPGFQPTRPSVPSGESPVLPTLHKSYGLSYSPRVRTQMLRKRIGLPWSCNWMNISGGCFL